MIPSKFLFSSLNIDIGAPPFDLYASFTVAQATKLFDPVNGSFMKSVSAQSRALDKTKPSFLTILALLFPPARVEKYTPSLSPSAKFQKDTREAFNLSFSENASVSFFHNFSI